MSDLIARAKPQEKKLKDNHSGQMWSIPYSLTPARDDIDKGNSNILCVCVCTDMNCVYSQK